MEFLKKIRIDVIALLLIPICLYFFGIIGVGISAVLLTVYIFSSKKRSVVQRIFLFICLVGLIISFAGYLNITGMESVGIDGIGEALLYLMKFRLGIIVTSLCAIIILIIDNIKSILSKKFLIIIITILVGVCLYYIIYSLVTTRGVSSDIPSVSDFKTELKSRGFSPDTDNYRLYGVNNKSKKGMKLYFDKNQNDKYPLYVYSIIDYPWLIYYVNGEIYAIRGKYWDYYTAYNRNSGYNEEKIIWDVTLFDSTNKVISETDEIIIYDRELNRYKHGSIVHEEDFNYYSKDQNKENSVFIDIPSIDSWGYDVTKIDRIDYNSLNIIYNKSEEDFRNTIAKYAE